MTYTPDDVRSVLVAPTRAEVGTRAPREPCVFTWAGDRSRPGTPAGHSRYVRGQNLCISHTVLEAGVALSETGIPDEHVVLLPEGDATVAVSTDAGDVVLDQPGLAIVPSGTSSLIADRDCVVLRVFSSRARSVLARAENDAMYLTADPAVTPLSPGPPPGGGPARVIFLTDIPQDPARLGRIFLTDSLMINWFPPQEGPRDPEKLSPHVHEDFEQASVTLRGDYIHHFRSPWTPRLSEWRDDQTVPCASPSVAIIPPGIIHFTRAVGAGMHQLIDIFAPPRADFMAQGWALNADEYPQVQAATGAEPRNRRTT